MLKSVIDFFVAPCTKIWKKVNSTVLLNTQSSDEQYYILGQYFWVEEIFDLGIFDKTDAV